MNQHELKQYLFNNLWFGENQRARFTEDDDSQALATALLQPDYFRVWGPDESHWGGEIDLYRAKSLGCSFIFIKGLDGTIRTRWFAENFTRATILSIERAPYQWLYRNSNVSCVAQAQAMNDLCNQYPPTLPPVIDFEATRYGGVSSNPDFTDLRKWATEYLRLGNPKPLLYSGKYYMDGFGQMPADLMDMFAGLWLARYWPTNDPPLPPLPLGWNESQLKYYQWTASGDQNYIAPSSLGKLELDLNYRIGASVPLPPPTGGTMLYGKVNVGVLNVRSGPGASYTDIGDLLQDDYVIASENVGGWWRLTKANRGGWNGAPVALSNGVLIENASNVWCSGAYVLPVDAPPVTEKPKIEIVYNSAEVDITLKPQ